MDASRDRITADDILDWLQQGRLRRDDLPAALRLAGITPGPADWLRFLDRLCLWAGALLLGAAAIFFLAYNWQEMGRFAKFGLVELAILAGLALCWRIGVDRVAGKALLLAIALLLGALLALVGQIYQTGADTFELFAAWAAVVLPLAAAGRFAALWLFWLALLNLALVLYFQTFGMLFGWIFDPERMLWALFALDTAALCVWEAASRSGVPWLRERWAARVLAVASGGQATALAVWAIVDAGFSRAAAAAAYMAWMAGAYLFYRYRTRDLFVLAGGVLSAIIVAAVWLSKQWLRHEAAGAYLLIGLIVIGLSAAGGIWLKAVAAEDRT
ncbi:MAG TPA: DUF2157 domain-containing protein [Paucimonas sp.]|nr:DUF2157 domain-containing protein [Paucimonas sp.]